MIFENYTQYTENSIASHCYLYNSCLSIHCMFSLLSAQISAHFSLKWVEYWSTFIDRLNENFFETTLGIKGESAVHLPFVSLIHWFYGSSNAPMALNLFNAPFPHFAIASTFNVEDSRKTYTHKKCLKYLLG